MTALDADKIKMQFEFKTNEKRVWIKVFYTYLFDTFYAQAHALCITYIFTQKKNYIVLQKQSARGVL